MPSVTHESPESAAVSGEPSAASRSGSGQGLVASRFSPLHQPARALRLALAPGARAGAARRWLAGLALSPQHALGCSGVSGRAGLCCCLIRVASQPLNPSKPGQVLMRSAPSREPTAPGSLAGSVRSPRTPVPLWSCRSGTDRETVLAAGIALCPVPAPLLGRRLRGERVPGGASASQTGLRLVKLLSRLLTGWRPVTHFLSPNKLAFHLQASHSSPIGQF